MALVTKLSLRIYGGAQSTGFSKEPLVSVGNAPDGIIPMPPTIVDEPQSWFITHAQSYTMYALYSKRYNTSQQQPGQLLFCLFMPVQQRLGEGKSPLGLLDSLMDQFAIQGLVNDCLPDSAIDSSPFKILLDRYKMEQRPLLLPIMQGHEAAAFCVENRSQLDALMRHSRYPVLGGVGRLELGFHCKSTISLSTTGNSQGKSPAAAKPKPATDSAPTAQPAVPPVPPVAPAAKPMDAPKYDAPKMPEPPIMQKPEIPKAPEAPVAPKTEAPKAPEAPVAPKVEAPKPPVPPKAPSTPASPSSPATPSAPRPSASIIPPAAPTTPPHRTEAPQRPTIQASQPSHAKQPTISTSPSSANKLYTSDKPKPKEKEKKNNTPLIIMGIIAAAAAIALVLFMVLGDGFGGSDQDDNGNQYAFNQPSEQVDPDGAADDFRPEGDDDAALKAEEEAARKAAEDAKKAAEEAARQAAEDAKKAADEAARKAAEDAKKAADEAVRKKAEEERKKAEEERKKREAANWKTAMQNQARNLPITLRSGVRITSINVADNSVTFTLTYDLAKFDIDETHWRQFKTDQNDVKRRYASNLPAGVNAYVILRDCKNRPFD